MSKKSIMITGVSTGIGLGTLSYFVKNGFHVYGSVRNSKDASRLKKIYKDNFTPLIFDVTKEAQLKKAVAFLKKDLKNSNLLALVNNAGVAISGPLLHQKVKDFEKQIDLYSLIDSGTTGIDFINPILINVVFFIINRGWISFE